MKEPNAELIAVAKEAKSAIYDIRTSDSPWEPLYAVAKTAAEARKIGRRYIRDWDICGSVESVKLYARYK